jgi:putative ubiquitin-RnfH superfamily antitoxin RatB of RatAB toxin-antitoxin module
MNESVSDSKIDVQVCYAPPNNSMTLSLQVSVPTNVGQAIAISGILSHFPEIDLTKSRVGIFGKISTLDVNLRQGDRVEIYRALVADPMEARRRRAIKHATSK